MCLLQSGDRIVAAIPGVGGLVVAMTTGGGGGGFKLTLAAFVAPIGQLLILWMKIWLLETKPQPVTKQSALSVDEDVHGYEEM